MCGDASFQLTPSRRATFSLSPLHCVILISTHALTEGDFRRWSLYYWCFISTHALTEGDRSLRLLLENCFSFQLTPSRRATAANLQYLAANKFQLTPSRRATCKEIDDYLAYAFQLTPSRRATICRRCSKNFLGISTHALTEGDQIPERIQAISVYFNSRPHGGRHTSKEFCKKV